MRKLAVAHGEDGEAKKSCSNEQVVWLQAGVSCARVSCSAGRVCCLARAWSMDLFSWLRFFFSNLQSPM